MSLFRRDGTPSTQQIIPARVSLGGTPINVTSEDALRQSVIWAALNLRASLVSMMPVDVYRKLPDGHRVNIATPAVLRAPDEFADGHPVTIGDWLYASEMSLGQYGNHWGIVHSIDSNKCPTRIETVQPRDVTMRIKGSRITQYKIYGEPIDSRFVWHERRHLLPGVPAGLSPVMYSALSIAMSSSASQYAADWFTGSAIPAAHLRNSERKLDAKQSADVKARFKETMAAGDIFVTGKEWEYTPLQAKAAEAGFLEAMGHAARDLVRYYGVPGDVIDVPSDGSAITYANITQRNVQLMTINMGPSLKSRDDALSTLTPQPQFVKLNRSAMLAMDDQTRASVIKTRIDSRTLTPSQARLIEDEPALTEADLAEFDRLFGNKNLQPPKGVVPA